MSNQHIEEIFQSWENKEHVSFVEVINTTRISRSVLDTLIDQNILHSVTFGKSEGGFRKRNIKTKELLDYLRDNDNFNYLFNPDYLTSKEIQDYFNIEFNAQDKAELNLKLQSHRIRLSHTNSIQKFPKNLVEEFINKRFPFRGGEETFNRDLILNDPNYLTTKEASIESKLKSSYIRKMVNDGKMTRSIKIGAIHYIHRLDLKSLLEELQEHEDKSSLSRIEDFLLKFEKASQENRLPVTHSLYRNHVIDILNRSNSFRSRVNLHINTYTSLMSLLTQECTELSDDELLFIFRQDIPVEQKQRIRNFLLDVKLQCEVNYSQVPKIKSKQSNFEFSQNDIYSIEEYSRIYNHLRNVELHKGKALRNHIYAQCWFYTLMHFCNAWRSPDIIMFPSPELSLLEVENISFEWVRENNISLTQGKKLIDFLRETNEFIINKTNALNKFFVNHDMIVPLSTALVILELYKQELHSDLLLPSFVNSAPRVKQTKKVLGENLPDFYSKKATKSFLTFMHRAANETGKYAGVSNMISTRLRGHRDVNTISYYVLPDMENEDSVASHLFRRGHFGYLYSILVDIVTASEEKELTTEEKTQIIEILKNVFTPQDVQKIGNYYLKQQNKLNSLAIEVLQMPISDLKEKLIMLFEGDLPSNELNAQCFVSGNCTNPTGNCFNCKYVIPKADFINSISMELFSIINQLKQIPTTQEAELMKFTHLLYEALDLIKQANTTFGKEYVSTYLDIKKIQHEIQNVSGKLLS